MIIARRTTLQPKAITLVPVKPLEGEWLIEPLQKWAGAQGIPAVYRDPQGVAMVNLTDRVITWRAGLVVGDAAPLEEDLDLAQGRVKALQAIKQARGGDMENPSLD